MVSEPLVIVNDSTFFLSGHNPTISANDRAVYNNLFIRRNVTIIDDRPQ